MTLIKSVSGFRGTIGGKQGENLTPPDIVAFTSAYAKWLLQEKPNSPVVVTGRDGRISGSSLLKLVNSTLSFCGVHVIDCDLSTTPSVEMAVLRKGADGGIICTASHNPAHWNALKFLNARGEFISSEEGKQIVKWAESESFEYAPVSRIGRIVAYPDSIRDHIDDVLKMELVDAGIVRNQKWHLAVDAINSTGSIAIPLLLENLGIRCTLINGSDFGYFAHEAEPLPKNLKELSETVRNSDAILGVAVDPDVDRLVLIAEDGKPFGEEYTLVALADYYLREKGIGPTVSNLSSSMALADVTKKHGGTHFQSAVGERHVVDEMKKRGAIIGGEGNGGIICPDLHYGRDAIAGLALFLTFLAKTGKQPSALRSEYPHYAMAKEKIELSPALDTDQLLEDIAAHFSEEDKNNTDGLKIYFDQSWVHIRKSNTEPILRIYTEAPGAEGAVRLARQVKDIIESIK